MSEKRKLEEYHDPDYPQTFQFHRAPDSTSQPPSKVSKPNVSVAGGRPSDVVSIDTRAQKIINVVKREFETEIKAKEREIDEIERRILRGRQLLAKVRYAVIQSYYTKKNLVYSEQDVRQFEQEVNPAAEASPAADGTMIDSDKGLQMAVHPSLKKILGKRPLDYNEILKVRPIRRAAKNATEKFQELKKPAATKVKMMNITIPAEPVNEVAIEATDTDTGDVAQKVPKYISPTKAVCKIPQINSSRGRNYSRHLLVVGNTSKYIGHEELDSATNVTHKWLVYVTTKTPTPIERIVSKVRYILHESYKPNDIVEISSPPFQLSKRGWGEFQLRLQLFFHPHLQQKPIDILHNLVLDKEHSGLQTMGAETTVELWINLPTSDNATIVTEPKLSTAAITKTDPKVTPISIKNEMKSEQLISTVRTSTAATSLTNVPKSHTTIRSNQTVTASTAANGPISSNGPTIAITASKHLNTMSSSNSQPILNVQPIATQAKLLNSPITVAKVSNMETKKFVKCIDKNGKVSLVQIIADPNNPKILRIVSNGGPITAAPVTSIVPNSKGQTGVSTTAPRIITLPKQIMLPKANAANLKIVSVANAISQGLFIRSVASTPGTLPASVNSLPTLPVASTQSPSTSQFPQIPPQSISTSIKTATSLKHPIVIKKNSAVPQYSNQLNAMKVIRPQQSLLKPQISLLRPVNADKAKLPLQAIVDNRNLKMVTVENIKGLQNRKINVFIKQEPIRDRSTSDIETSAKKIYSKPKRQYAEKLEQLFFANHFSNICGAVNWLLRRIPLITSLALAPQYRESFPFIVESEQKYNKLFVAKQRSFEWLRAKYVNRLIQQHPDLLAPGAYWTTKQLIIFGRKFGYTPAHVPTTGDQSSKSTKSATSSKSTDLKQMIQTEINREHLMNDTISFNHSVNVWLAKAADSLKTDDTKHKFRLSIDDDEGIVVDDDDNASAEKQKLADIKATEKKPVAELLVPDNLRTECSWIVDICRSVQLKLQPEEIVNGVIHNSSQVVLTTALRSFFEELIRRSHASKSTSSSINSIQEVNAEDIQRAIISTKHFDFLTNKHLGVAKADSSS